MDAADDMLILVDSNDKETGSDTKKNCHHVKPKLHRAFSIFLFNSKNELLITKRSSVKKTWPGFWSNTVCSHPRKGEAAQEAAARRLKEELGVSVPLKFLFKFEYEARYNSEWGEKELDWVFAGRYKGKITPDKNEIEDYKFVSLEALKKDMQNNPDSYTPWFKICVGRAASMIDKI